jgi:hypothetical protein
MSRNGKNPILPAKSCFPKMTFGTPSTSPFFVSIFLWSNTKFTSFPFGTLDTGRNWCCRDFDCSRFELDDCSVVCRSFEPHGQRIYYYRSWASLEQLGVFFVADYICGHCFGIYRFGIMDFEETSLMPNLEIGHTLPAFSLQASTLFK